jgi:hypothetical protein
MDPVRVWKEPIAMKIIMDRSYCDASLSFCARCSAAFFRKPLGTDRLCIIDIIDDGRDELLRIELRTDGRTLEFDLTEDVQKGLTLEGWEFLADFEPGFFRTGAAQRWRALANLPASHQAPGHTP